MEQNLEFISNKNTTSISLEYQNEEIQTAKITAEFDGDEFTKINLEKPEDDYSYLSYPLGLIPLVIIGYFLYKKLKRSKKISVNPIIPNKTPKKFNYVLASNDLIQEGKR